MKKILLLSIALFNFFIVFAQPDENSVYDPKAKEVLDDLSEKLKDKNARLYFLYTVYNAQDSSETEYYGYLFVKDENKYKVLIPEVEVFSDGIKTYNYNKKNNEMNITYVNPENEMVYTPQKMITAYKSGFKYSYRGEVNFDAKTKIDGKIKTKNKTCHIVDLYPENVKKSAFSIIRIWIDKTNNQLVSAKYQHRNGIEEVVEILKFEIDIKINDDIFKFDPSKYPKNLDIIDFTEE